MDSEAELKILRDPTKLILVEAVYIVIALWCSRKRGEENRTIQVNTLSHILIYGYFGAIVYVTLLMRHQYAEPQRYYDFLRLLKRCVVKQYDSSGSVVGMKFVLAKPYLETKLNFLMFLPFGLVVPLQWRMFRKLLRTALLAGTVSFTIEAVQYYTRLGLLDPDDIIVNALGAIAGYGIYKMFYGKNHRWRFSKCPQ